MPQETSTQTDMQLIQIIAERMRDPNSVKEIVSDPKNKNPDPIVEFDLWSDLSIAGGYPGVLPLFIELDHLFPQEGWSLIAHNYIVKIAQIIEDQGISSLTLYSGLAGVCFYLRQASRNEQRYKKILDKLDSYLIKNLPITHLEPLKKQLEKSIPRRPALYEVIQGISGIGIYALINYSKTDFKELVHQMIQQLIWVTQPIEIKGKIVPGWYVSPEFFFLEEEVQKYPNGNFNLGLSHGIAGVLAFLSIAMIDGVQIEGIKESIQTIAKWIQSKRKKNDDRFFWDSTISFEEETSKESTDDEKSRDAWCYGTPGVARSLYLAGKALEDEAMKEFALEAFISIFKNSREEWNLPGPTICHGISGLLMITQLMARDSASSFLYGRVQELKEILLSHYDSSSHFGFKNADLQKENKGEFAWIDRADILEGASGVLLTFLSLHAENYQWHFPLLIDDLSNMKK